MKIVEKYERSRTAEEDVMQDGLSYDGLYTKLSASLVIWKNGMTQMGQDPDTTDDRRMRKSRPRLSLDSEHSTQTPHSRATTDSE